MAVVFTANPDGTYDLTVDGRAKEYDVEADDFVSCLRRARLKPGTKIYVEDLTGYRTPLSGR